MPSDHTAAHHHPARRARVRRLAAVALAGSLVLAACSDDDDAVDATADTESTAPTTTAGEGAGGEAGTMGAFGPACGSVPMDGEGSFAGMADDPAATAASNNPLLSTLVTAVSEAGLVDTLNGDGPFTVFAPTNDAFAALPPEQLDAVLADADLLTGILTYHVVAGESLDADALGEAGTVETVEGSTLELGADGTTVNGADVVCSDVPTANATVHIVDEVLLPPAALEAIATMGDGAGASDQEAMADGAMTEGMLPPSGPACAAVPADGEGSFAGMADDPAATAASNNPVLSTLVTAVDAAGLVDTLNGPGPFTIFAPTNDAFAAIAPADLDAIVADVEQLTSILTYHVIAGEQLDSAALVDAGSAVTVNGAELTFADEGGLTVNGARAVCMDVPTANATVHIVDAVLVPTA